MANPSGIQNGTKGLLYRDGVLVCGATSNGSSVSRVLVESTNKCSEEFRTIIPNSGTVTFDHSLEAFWSDDLGFDAVVGDWNSGAKVSFTFVYGDSGKEDSFVAVVESISNGYERDTPVSSTISLKSTESFTVNQLQSMPRQDFYYQFKNSELSMVEIADVTGATSQIVIPDPYSDDFFIEFKTGSILPQNGTYYLFCISQFSDFINDVFYISSFNKFIRFAFGDNAATNTAVEIVANKTYQIRITGTSYEVLVDGVSSGSGSFNRATLQNPIGSAKAYFMGGLNSDLDPVNTIDGIYYDLKVEPLNSSSFNPLYFYLDDNSDTLMDQNGNYQGLIRNYNLANWQGTP